MNPPNKYISLFIPLLLCIACNNSSQGNSGNFNPQKRKHGDLLNISYNGINNMTTDSTLTCVKLSILVPIIETLDQSQLGRIERKMIQLTSPFGIIGNGEGNPKHVLAPILELASIEATSTAPTRYLAKYDVTFYVADVISGTIFNSAHKQVSGIGRSKEEAFINAIENLSPDQEFSKFIGLAQDRLIQYFKENGDAIIAEANSMEIQQNYAGAIALLESIPVADSIHYTAARSKIDVIIPKYLKATSDDLLTKMKVAIGSAPSDTINIAAMEYYQMIPADSPCKADADILYNNYISRLSSEQAAKAERKMKELEADNAFRLREAELKAEVEGNTMLLEKYKKDAAYDRLPWLRKLIYLGDKDPFDGYEPKKNI